MKILIVEDSCASFLVLTRYVEEFFVVLAETSLRGTLIVAEKIRHAVHELNISHSASPFGCVTLSIGIAAAIPEKVNSLQKLIGSADRALYHGKHEGRDRVYRSDRIPEA